MKRLYVPCSEQVVLHCLCDVYVPLVSIFLPYPTWLCPEFEFQEHFMLPQPFVFLFLPLCCTCACVCLRLCISSAAWTAGPASPPDTCYVTIDNSRQINCIHPAAGS